MSRGDINRPIWGHLLAFCANFLWGLMAPVGKEALLMVSPMILTTCRMLGAGICFWILSIFIGPKERVVTSDLCRLFLASFLALSINQGLYITGLSMTSPIHAAIITTLLPVFTMMFAILLLNESINAYKLVGVGLGFIGAVTILLSSTSSKSEGNLWGDLLCLSSPICFSLYLTLFKDLTIKYSAVTVNKWMFLMSSVTYLPFNVGHFIDFNWSELSSASILAIMYVVLGGSFVAYLCIMTAQKYIRPTLLSTYNYTAPIIATITAIILGNGTISITIFFSMFSVFVGVYFVSKGNVDVKKVR